MLSHLTNAFADFFIDTAIEVIVRTCFTTLIPAVHTVDDVITHLVSLDTLSRLVTAPGQVCQHASNITPKPD